MPYAPRPTTVFPASTTTSRQTSSNFTSSQQSALASRIAAKRSELENLKQLRDLSGALAEQMGALEEKLATLRDGTEAVACVLANWDNVLRAISMASSECLSPFSFVFSARILPLPVRRLADLGMWRSESPEAYYCHGEWRGRGGGWGAGAAGTEEWGRAAATCDVGEGTGSVAGSKTSKVRSRWDIVNTTLQRDDLRR